MIESVTRIEPCGFEEQVPADLKALAAEVREASQKVGAGLHPDVRSELRWAVRVANAYPSNMLEGYVSDPIEIGGALTLGASDPLVRMAVAHVQAEERIGAEREDDLPPFSVEAVLGTHRRLYEAMPEEFRVQPIGGHLAPVVPGGYREHEAEVGRHMPPSPARLPDFMKHFEMRYRALARGPLGSILSLPAAHHRLAYIHPFADGNGRVGRLMTHGMLQSAGIDGHGLWSLSRGLYGGLEAPGEYHRQMDAADHPRRGDRDGRGNLSLAGLGSYTRWFLQVLLKEIRYAEQAFDPAALATRAAALANGTPETEARLLAALTEGGTSRAHDASLGGLAALGLLAPDPARDDFMKMKFPATLWGDLLPGLFAPALPPDLDATQG